MNIYLARDVVLSGGIGESLMVEMVKHVNLARDVVMVMSQVWREMLGVAIERGCPQQPDFFHEIRDVSLVSCEDMVIGSVLGRYRHGSLSCIAEYECARQNRADVVVTLDPARWPYGTQPRVITPDELCSLDRGVCRDGLRPLW